jgi:FAD/FMN-containing dehydrogenase
MVATNPGRTKVIGFGDVRRLTLGLEVVIADEDATVLDMLGGLRKNKTGLDLKQIFVATGGTYGVVTAATFELVPRPKQVATAWVVVADDDAAFGLLQAAHRHAWLGSRHTCAGDGKVVTA